MKSPTYEHYLIIVRDEMDIGINEKRRFKIEKMEPLRASELTIGEAGCKVYGKCVTPATPKRPPTSTTQCRETENSHSTRGNTFYNPDDLIPITDSCGSDIVKVREIEHLLQKVSDLESQYSKLREEIQQLRRAKVEPKQSWMDKMHQRIQAVENKNTKQFDKLHARLQKLEPKPAIEAGMFVVADPNGSIRPCEKNETPHGLTVKPIYCKECGNGFAQLNIDENGICCMCSQLEKYREKPPAESDPLEEADKQLKEILHNLAKEQPNMRRIPDKPIDKPYLIKVTTDTEKGIRIEFV